MLRSLRLPAIAVIAVTAVTLTIPVLGLLPSPWSDGEPRWRSSSPEVFERTVQGLELEWSEGRRISLPRDTEEEDLVLALAEPSALATRAAVLLGWVALAGEEGPSSRAVATLIGRLEQRIPAPSRALDAVDVVAAAALARLPEVAGLGPRLAVLTDGPGKHPDLEVRVECAGGALLGGQREVIPFLLRVLRSGTPAEQLDPPDWPRKMTMSWAKSRAAELLSRSAGQPCTFRPDGSFEHQMRTAEALEAALSKGPR